MRKATLYERSHGYALKQDERGKCAVAAILRIAEADDWSSGSKWEAIEAYLASAYVAGYDRRRREKEGELKQARVDISNLLAELYAIQDDNDIVLDREDQAVIYAIERRNPQPQWGRDPGMSPCQPEPDKGEKR